MTADVLACVRVISLFEGYKLNAYQDSAGIWTIGIGHTGADVHEGLVWTPAQAQAALATDLQATFSWTLSLIDQSITDSFQQTAMVSLAYNIGVQNFSTSSVRRFHNAGNFSQASTSFLLWDKVHVDGVLEVSDGLVNRRNQEAAIYSRKFA